MPERPLSLYLVWWKHTPECPYMAPEKMLAKMKLEVETDLQKVIRKLDKLTADVEELKNDQPRTLQAGKFSFAPTHVGEEEDVLSSMIGPARGRQQGACQNRAPDLLSSDPEGELQDSEVQAAYQNIVDSVQKFRLPASLKCNIGQPKGIKRKDHLCVNILSKCGASQKQLSNCCQICLRIKLLRRI